MTKLGRTSVRAAAALCVLAAGAAAVTHADEVPAAKPAPATVDAPVLDLSHAAIPIKVDAQRLQTVRFDVGHTGDEAWATRVANSNPRSPAAADGAVVVGSGSGKDVYCFEGDLGTLRWHAKSPDSGISSIVINNDRAYYTTYSCTLEAVQVSTGKVNFVKWLAPTVNCAPDVSGDAAVAAYYKGDGNQVSMHDAATGDQKWITPVGGSSVLTAPVLQGSGVFLTTADGAIKRIDAGKGKLEWSASMGAVSAPVPTKWGLLLTTTWDGKQPVNAGPVRQLTEAERRARDRETVSSGEPLAGTLAAHKDRRVALLTDTDEKPEANNNVKPTGPRADLDFQGSRPGVGERSVFFAYSGKVVCIDPLAGTAKWSVQVSNASAVFTRPLVHEGLVFVADNTGIVCALEEATGALVWCYRVDGQRFMAEPAADADRAYFTTGSGLLIAMPIGIKHRVRGAVANGDGGVEGAAAEYWRVQHVFRNVRSAVREVADEQPAPAPGNNAGNRNAPGNGGDNGNRVAEPAERREDEAEELTKGQWERREDRRAAKAKTEGKRYEKRPFKR